MLLERSKMNQITFQEERWHLIAYSLLCVRSGSAYGCAQRFEEVLYFFGEGGDILITLVKRSRGFSSPDQRNETGVTELVMNCP